MNALERTAWLQAVDACLDGKTQAAAETAAALDAAGVVGWEVSVPAGELDSIGLRCHAAGDGAGLRRACAKAFGLTAEEVPEAPAPGFPFLSAVWNLKSGQWTSLRLYGALKGHSVASLGKTARGKALAWDFTPSQKTLPPPVTLSPRPLRQGEFGEEALDRALEDFAALCPISSFTPEARGWALRPAQAPHWSAFTRCDLSAAFTPKSAQLALLLLDRRVVELSFDGEALWAHCAG